MEKYIIDNWFKLWFTTQVAPKNPLYHMYAGDNWLTIVNRPGQKAKNFLIIFLFLPRPLNALVCNRTRPVPPFEEPDIVIIFTAFTPN